MTAIITVLQVDNNESFLELTGNYVSEIDRKISIDAVSSAGSALQFLGTWDYDVLVCDYQMSGMNGLELLEIVRKRGH